MTDTTSPRIQRIDTNASTLGRLLIVTAICIAVAVVPFASGLIGALILSVLCRPAYDRLRRWMRPSISAVLVVFGIVVLVLAPSVWLASTLVVESRDAVRLWHGGDLPALLKQSPIGNLPVFDDLAQVSSTIVGWISSHAVAWFGGIASAIINAMIALFGVYYLLIGGSSMWQRLAPLLPVRAETSDLLVTRFYDVTNALLLGTGLTVAVQGTLVGIAFVIVGLSPAVLWGFVTACAAVLPVVGSGLVWLPATAILLLQHRPGAAIFMGVYGAALVSNIDNLIRPLIYRRVSGIHPMFTIVGAFAGLRALGIVGALIGPLVLSYFFELLDVYERTASGPENRD